MQESRLNVEKGVTLAWQDIYVYTQVSIPFPLELGIQNNWS